MVNKITWQRAGGITEPGRYMYTFGWLTVTPNDLAIWKQFPEASFTLVELPPHDEEPTTARPFTPTSFISARSSCR